MVTQGLQRALVCPKLRTITIKKRVYSPRGGQEKGREHLQVTRFGSSGLSCRVRELNPKTRGTALETKTTVSRPEM